jgi:hypothetical protein
MVQVCRACSINVIVTLTHEQDTTDGFVIFLVQPQKFAGIAGWTGSYTLLLRPVAISIELSLNANAAVWLPGFH